MASGGDQDDIWDEMPEPANDGERRDTKQDRVRSQEEQERPRSRGSFLTRLRPLTFLRRRNREIPQRRASFSESSFRRSPRHEAAMNFRRRRCMSVHVDSELPRVNRQAFAIVNDAGPSRPMGQMSDSPPSPRRRPDIADASNAVAHGSGLSNTVGRNSIGARRRTPHRSSSRGTRDPPVPVRPRGVSNDNARNVNRRSTWTSIKVRLRSIGSMFSRRNGEHEDDIDGRPEVPRREPINRGRLDIDGEEIFASVAEIWAEADKARASSNGQHVYYDVEYCIPRKICKVINCYWYWGDIDRFEAHEVLKKEEDGVFLLRRSTHPEFLFTISFKRYNKTLHVRIETGYTNPDDPSSRASSANPQKFTPTYSRLLDLIDTSGEHPESMYLIPLLLTPLARKTPHTLKELSRAAVCNNVDYNNVDDLPIPEELKIYIREFRYKIRKYYLK